MVKEVESFYDKISGNYSNHEDRICDRIVEHFIIDNIPKNKTLKILDAGGGIGRFSEPLLKKGHQVVLTELSKGMLNKAKNKLKSLTLIARPRLAKIIGIWNQYIKNNAAAQNKKNLGRLSVGCPTHCLTKYVLKKTPSIRAKAGNITPVLTIIMLCMLT